MAALDRLETAVRAEPPDLAGSWLAELEEFATASGAGPRRSRSWSTVVPCWPTARMPRSTSNSRSPPTPSPSGCPTEPAPSSPTASTCVVPAAGWTRGTPTHSACPFEQLGADAWVERASQELRASGETARRRDVSTATELTAQERHVTALVRQGLSNKDVAAQLFVSPRTVDFHLRNVFTKLGVTSRARTRRPPARHLASRPGSS